MQKPRWWAFAALTAALGVILGVGSPAQSQRPPEKPTIAQLVAKKSKVAPDDVVKVLKALSPVIREQLGSGEVVEIPGLGTFRVVRIPEHRDLIKGRPGMIAETNNVEFVAGPDLIQIANSATAVPAATVPQFEFDPLPDQYKGERAPSVRQPNVRTR